MSSGSVTWKVDSNATDSKYYFYIPYRNGLAFALFFEHSEITQY